MHEWADAMAGTARAAGAEIMAIYRQDFSVSHKQDASPLTQADLAAHRLIVGQLTALNADIPI
jgi:3'(2'), 5'-bisphosphate nucleotidase